MTDATGPWYKWAWRHFSLAVDEYATYEEAIKAAQYMSDDGAESLDCIEGPMGVVDPAKVQDDLNSAEAVAYKAYTEGRKATHGVKITAPNGEDEAWFSTYYDEASAETAADRLRERFGDRVRVVVIGQPVRP